MLKVRPMSVCCRSILCSVLALAWGGCWRAAAPPNPEPVPAPAPATCAQPYLTNMMGDHKCHHVARSGALLECPCPRAAKK